MRYSSVAARDSVRICLLIAALNGLDIMSTDIGNAYLNAKCKEKVHINKIGSELFGPECEGRSAIIVRALYGLASAGNSWRQTLRNTIIKELGFFPCTADPDVYMKMKTKDDGTKYYSYLIVYVDDIICTDINPKATLSELGEIYQLKGGIIFPDIYLGNNIRKWKYTNTEGIENVCYAMGSSSYIKEAVRVAENHQKCHDIKFPKSRKESSQTPFSHTDYRPELESSAECNAELTQIYQNLIGILRWCCELGRIDILLEVSLLSQYLVQLRIGHLEQVMNVFRYLKRHDRSWNVLDPTDYNIEWQPKNNEPSPWERANAMKELYHEAELKCQSH